MKIQQMWWKSFSNMRALSRNQLSNTTPVMTGHHLLGPILLLPPAEELRKVRVNKTIPPPLLPRVSCDHSTVCAPFWERTTRTIHPERSAITPNKHPPPSFIHEWDDSPPSARPHQPAARTMFGHAAQMTELERQRACHNLQSSSVINKQNNWKHGK
jgi:hypothetical protein